MTFKPTVHDDFTIERDIAAAPALVFQAWATLEGKNQWFGSRQAKERLREMDFRVGGREVLAGQFPNGVTHEFRAQYFDIKPNERIVYVYEMFLDGVKISTSLATIDFAPKGKGTHMVVTEQHAFVDGYEDKGSRERGTNDLMDALVACLSPKN